MMKVYEVKDPVHTDELGMFVKYEDAMKLEAENNRLRSYLQRNLKHLPIIEQSRIKIALEKNDEK